MIKFYHLIVFLQGKEITQYQIISEFIPKNSSNTPNSQPFAPYDYWIKYQTRRSKNIFDKLSQEISEERITASATAFIGIRLFILDLRNKL